MLSYLQFDPRYNGQKYCKFTQIRQLIAQLPKLIHWLLIFSFFIHCLYFVLRIFYLMFLGGFARHQTHSKTQPKMTVKSLILMSPSRKGGFLRTRSNG